MGRALSLTAALRRSAVVATVSCFCVGSAVAQGPQAPVVFIPGFIGSKLVDGSGKVIWGDMVATIRRFSDLALPLPPARDDIRSTGVLDEVTILGPFSMGQYGGFVDFLKQKGFREGETLFPFHYDWRQSNFETARKLREFVEATPRLREGKFDIVAHSMGGLVARAYIGREGGDVHVRQLITVGTPYQGSVNALRTILEGWGRWQTAILGGRDVMLRVVLSFPSVYELLPSYDGCCTLGKPSDQVNNVALATLKPDRYRQFGWIPAAFESDVARRAWVDAAFASARDLRELVAQPLPDAVKLRVIAGDLVATHAQLLLDPTTGRLVKDRKMPGDGTVFPISAANGAGPLADAGVAIHEHATMLDDEHVRVALSRFLIEPQKLRPFAFGAVTGSVLTRSNQKVEVGAVEVALDAPLYRPGTGVVATIHVFAKAQAADQEMQPIADVEVDASLVDASGRSQALPVGESPPGTYLSVFDAPAAGGVYRIETVVPTLGELGRFRESFVVVPEETP